MQVSRSAIRALRLVVLLGVGGASSIAAGQYPPPQGARPAQPPRAAAARPLLFVPSVIGSNIDAAQERLRQFRVERREVPSVRAAGVVVGQEPRAPEQRPAGSLVRIEVSDGSRVLVPPVRQRKLADARARMTANNLVVAVVERESDEIPGVVAAQNPVEGSEVARGSTIELIVSTGLAIPNVKGESLEEALRRLTRFKVQFTEIESGELKGTVVEQDPPAATRTAAGSRVALDVSDGTRVAVPDLQSTTLGFARSNLREAGLAMAVRNWPDHSDAVVKAQAPAARTQVRRGTVVELEVRPPTSWAIGAGAVLLLIAGYVGWLWRRPAPQPPVPRTPAASSAVRADATTTAPLRAEVELDPQTSISRVDGAESIAPAIRVDARRGTSTTTLTFGDGEPR
ncbi:MAG: PASTA domain-containing protein [Burkholderiaceae bacterium]